MWCVVLLIWFDTCCLVWIVCVLYFYLCSVVSCIVWYGIVLSRIAVVLFCFGLLVCCVCCSVVLCVVWFICLFGFVLVCDVALGLCWCVFVCCALVWCEL